MQNSPSLDFFEQKKHSLINTLHTWLLVSGSLLLLAVCAWVFMGETGIIYALVFGGISFLVAGRISPKMVLGMYKARQVSREQFPAGHAIMDKLVERAGLAHRPTLNVVPSQMMNAFAVGRIDDSAIALTDQLIRNLTKRELAGVMAHEMAHIKNQDIKVMAIADIVSRFTSFMSTFGMIALFLNLPSILFGGGANVPWLAVVLLLFAPTIGGLLQMALSRAREFDADLGAVMMTGDPDGLAMALRKLEKIQGKYWEGLVLPGNRLPDPSILRTHPKTDDRVARLMALKRQRHAEEGNQEKVERASTIPKIKREWGRQGESKYSDFASLLEAHPVKTMFEDEDDAECLACEHSVNEPEGKPRIRIRRGGVWW